jgi:hypothetical protein
MPVYQMTCDASEECYFAGEHNGCFIFIDHSVCRHYKNKWEQSEKHDGLFSRSGPCQYDGVLEN